MRGSPNAGKPVGVKFEGGGHSRIEFDARSGAHINVFNGKAADTPHIRFKGNANTVRSVLRQLGHLPDLLLLNPFEWVMMVSGLLMDQAMETEKRSKLFYFNSNIEVQLGDVVEVKGFFKKHRGIVAYIPGLSIPRSEIEEDGTGDWLIRLDRGDFLSMAYVPDNPKAQPKKNISFVSRGSEGIVEPNENLGEE